MRNGDPLLSDLFPKVVEVLLRRNLWDRAECLDVLTKAVDSGLIKPDGLTEKTRKAIDRHRPRGAD